MCYLIIGLQHSISHFYRFFMWLFSISFLVFLYRCSTTAGFCLCLSVNRVHIHSSFSSLISFSHLLPLKSFRFEFSTHITRIQCTVHTHTHTRASMRLNKLILSTTKSEKKKKRSIRLHLLVVLVNRRIMEKFAFFAFVLLILLGSQPIIRMNIIQSAAVCKSSKCITQWSIYIHLLQNWSGESMLMDWNVNDSTLGFMRKEIEGNWSKRNRFRSNSMNKKLRERKKREREITEEGKIKGSSWSEFYIIHLKAVKFIEIRF